MLTKPRVAMLSAALLSFAPLGAFAQSGSAIEVRDVKVSAPADGAARVSVTTSAEPRFFAHVAEQGQRLVVDVSGADVKGAPAAITRGNTLVGGVMTQAFDQDGKKVTRLIVNLAHPCEYRITTSASGLAIDLKTAETTAPWRADPLSGDAEKKVDAKVDTKVSSANAAVTNVRYDHQAGKDRVVVELSEGVKFSHATTSNGRSVLELLGVKLPDALERKLDVGAFGGPVAAISTYRRRSDPSHVIVEIEPRSSEAIGAVERVGNSIVVSFSSFSSFSSSDSSHSMLSGVGADGGVARRVRTVA